MKKNNYLSFIILLSIFSCTDSTRQSDLKLALQKKVDSLSNHVLNFDEFAKVDGIEKQGETLTYEMTYTGLVSGNKTCIWDRQIYAPFNNGGLVKAYESNDSTAINFLRLGYGIPVKGTAYFQKRDSGWKFINFTML